MSAAFIVSLMGISANLHRIFMRALVAREREAALAGQFDTALNNMPHGLCMFGADGRLAVINHRFSEMMNLRTISCIAAPMPRDIVSACVSAGCDLGARAEGDPLGNREFAGRRDRHHRSRRRSGRALSWTFQPMAGGGTVVLVEDITERRRSPKPESTIWPVSTN